MGLWQRAPIAALVAVLGIVITAAYLMIAVGKVFFGAMPDKFKGHISPLILQDKVALILLSGLMVLIGVFPSVIAPMVQSGAEAVLRLVGGA
jgi:NADH-quinone oxidoreductase subunit M